MLLALALVAAAAEPADVALPAAIEAGGLVLAVVPKPEVCTVDAWPDAQGWLDRHNATTIVLKPGRDTDVLKSVVAEGPYLPPMALAWAGGKELDRVCGCMEAKELAGWLGGLVQGHTRAGDLEATLNAEPKLDTTGWLRAAELHRCANRDEAALDALLVLWDRIPAEAPDQREIRLTRVAHDMAVLARGNDAVTARLVAMRDAIEADLLSDPAKQDDWVSLNRVLLDDDRTVAAWDDHKADTAWTRALQHMGSSLFVLLIERERWADASLVMPAPMVWLDVVRPASGGLELALDGYAALLAAGRDKEATPYAKELLKLAPEGTSCKLVDRALTAGQARKGHKALLKGCDEALVTRWEAALP